MAIERDMKLLTASDVAELCEVDLKTIHNWVERGCIPHFRTPGRHLRFRAVDVAGFLREWGYAIPRRFYTQAALSVVVLGGKEAVTFVQKAAGPGIAVHPVGDLYDCLLHIGAEPTSAVVIDELSARDWAESLPGAIGALRRAFDSLTIVVLGEGAEDPADEQRVAVVPMGDTKIMRAALVGDHQSSATGPIDSPVAAASAKLKRKPRKQV